MARRLGRFVGAAALVLVYLRLGRVLHPAPEAPDWRLLAPAAAAAGAFITAAGARLGAVGQALLHVTGLILVMLRAAVPATLTWGVLPGPETMAEASRQLGYAFEILRFGAPPVPAVAGITALVAAAMWLLGAAWTAAVAGDRQVIGLAPALGFYLYLALVDRTADSVPWSVAFAVVAALSLVATSDVVPAAAGRLRSPDHRPLPRWSAGPAVSVAGGLVVVAVGCGLVLGPLVPAGGAITWRNPGGTGDGTGQGFSVSRFVDLRQSILSLSDETVFEATVVGAEPEGPAGYWRQLTLSRFDGRTWSVGADRVEAQTAVLPTELDTRSAIQQVRVGTLQDQLLPTLFAPAELPRSTEPTAGYVLRSDGTLSMDRIPPPAMTYQLESQVPSLDTAALLTASTTATGMDEFVALPGLDPVLTQLARRETAGARSDLERALALEGFFRREFEYDLEVTTGHADLDLAAWMTRPDSRNYRTGYCEQFAAAMGVLARAVGLPTRLVIGFTGGERRPTDDGYVTTVRERNAHAWVEVWIEGQGWVGFDPTPRGDGTTQSLGDAIGFRPAAGTGADVGESLADSPAELGSPNLPVEDLRDVGTEGARRGLPAWMALAALAGAVGAIVPAAKALRRRRRHRRAAAGDVTAAWAEIVDRLADLGTPPPPDRTPVEFATDTSLQLLPLARAYSAAVYGNHPAGDSSTHLGVAERWVDEEFAYRNRVAAAFNPRSLLKR